MLQAVRIDCKGMVWVLLGPQTKKTSIHQGGLYIQAVKISEAKQFRYFKTGTEFGQHRYSLTQLSHS